MKMENEYPGIKPIVEIGVLKHHVEPYHHYCDKFIVISVGNEKGASNYHITMRSFLKFIKENFKIKMEAKDIELDIEDNEDYEDADDEYDYG